MIIRREAWTISHITSFYSYNWAGILTLLYHQVETVEKTALPSKEDIEAEKAAEASS